MKSEGESYFIETDKHIIVTPRDYIGHSWSLHPGGPKFTIKCGACPATFKDRIPIIELPSVQCPNCGTWNELDIVPENEQ